MKMRALMVVAVVCLVAAIGRLNAADEDAQKDQKLLQGTWKVTAMTLAGTETPKDEVKKMVFTIKDDTYTIKEGDTEEESGTFKLGPTEKPKNIDFVIKKGKGKGKTKHGIYTLTADNLKLCMSMPGKDRPKKLASEKDSGHILVVLKREKE
jgi:uncharacterized protein (TIGR03067 family)